MEASLEKDDDDDVVVTADDEDGPCPFVSFECELSLIGCCDADDNDDDGNNVDTISFVDVDTRVVDTASLPLPPPPVDVVDEFDDFGDDCMTNLSVFMIAIIHSLLMFVFVHVFI
jgi:hypothetical protein